MNEIQKMRRALNRLHDEHLGNRPICKRALIVRSLLQCVDDRDTRSEVMKELKLQLGELEIELRKAALAS